MRSSIGVVGMTMVIVMVGVLDVVVVMIKFILLNSDLSSDVI